MGAYSAVPQAVLQAESMRESLLSLYTPKVSHGSRLYALMLRALCWSMGRYRKGVKLLQRHSPPCCT